MVRKREKDKACDEAEGGGMGAKGLTNLGNTCFFNSVMQNLVRTRPFMDHMAGREDGPWENAGSLCEAMVEFCDEMSSPGGGTVKPSSLLAEVIRQEPRYGGGHQHDSHEALFAILDRMRTEEIKRIKEEVEAATDAAGASKDGGGDGVGKEQEENGKRGKRGPPPRTFVDDTFAFTLRHCTVCHTCGSESSRDESFLDLSLAIPLHFRKGGGGDEDSGKKRVGEKGRKGKKDGRGGDGAGEPEELSKRQKKELMKQQASKRAQAKARGVDESELPAGECVKDPGCDLNFQL